MNQTGLHLLLDAVVRAELAAAGYEEPEVRSDSNSSERPAGESESVVLLVSADVLIWLNADEVSFSISGRSDRFQRAFFSNEASFVDSFRTSLRDALRA